MGAFRFGFMTPARTSWPATNSVCALRIKRSDRPPNFSPRTTTSERWKEEPIAPRRSEEHTSELQSRLHLVCRLLLEKKKSDKTSASPREAGLHRSGTVPESHRLRDHAASI